MMEFGTKMDYRPLGRRWANLKRINSNPGYCSTRDYEMYL